MVTVPANGYAFVYVNNNSAIDVWFDNFVVSHQRGRILQENHYYPYGLQIAGISSKAAGKMDNMYRYQGAYSEFEEETGWNDFDLRTYDAQIGRWTGSDPYDEFASPYTGMGNDPVNNVDPSGGYIFGIESALVYHGGAMVIGAAAGAIYGGIKHGFDSKEVYQYAAWGAGAGAVASMGAYVPWDKVGGAFGDAGKWAGRQIDNVFHGYNNITLIGKLFKEETEAYNYMWKNSFDNNGNPDRENGGFLTENKGVIVLPNDKNDLTTTEFDRLKLRTNSKKEWTHVQLGKKWYPIKGSVHTHVKASASPEHSGRRMPSGEDFSLAKQRFPNVPNFVMSRVETFIYSGPRNTFYNIGSTKNVLNGKMKLSQYRY